MSRIESLKPNTIPKSAAGGLSLGRRRIEREACPWSSQVKCQGLPQAQRSDSCLFRIGDCADLWGTATIQFWCDCAGENTSTWRRLLCGREHEH